MEDFREKQWQRLRHGLGSDTSSLSMAGSLHPFHYHTPNPLLHYTLGNAFLGLPLHERLYLELGILRARFLPPHLPVSERRAVVMDESAQKPRSAGTGVFFPRRFEQKKDAVKNPTLPHPRRQRVFLSSGVADKTTIEETSPPSTTAEADLCFSAYDAGFSVRNGVVGGGRKSNTLMLPTEWTY